MQRWGIIERFVGTRCGHGGGGLDNAGSFFVADVFFAADGVSESGIAILAFLGAATGFDGDS